ncbi:MAG: MFS transporter [Candidatus Dormibacteraceae bacterium]
MTTATSSRAPSPWPALVVVSLGLFMTLLDLTIVNIAIPSMISSLHATFDQVLWVLNAYSLVYAVLLIVSGRLGDIFGPRNLLALGVGVFTLGSLVSSLAQSPSMLIAGRGVQGLGAAILAPQGRPSCSRRSSAQAGSRRARSPSSACSRASPCCSARPSSASS